MPHRGGGIAVAVWRFWPVQTGLNAIMSKKPGLCWAFFVTEVSGELGGAERDRTADLVIANNVLCCLLKGEGRGFLIPGLQVAVETPDECLGGLQIPCPGRFDAGLAADGHPKLKVPGSVNFEA